VRRQIKTLILVLCTMIGTAAVAQDYPRNLPPPVKRFIDRVIDCDHSLGEEPYDGARRAEINAVLHQLRCGSLLKDEIGAGKTLSEQPHCLETAARVDRIHEISSERSARRSHAPTSPAWALISATYS